MPLILPPALAGLDMTGGALPRERQGKSRDTHLLPDPALRLMFVSDRISVRNVVLNALFPGRGELGNAFTVFMKLKLSQEYGVITDLVAHGREIDVYLPLALRGNRDWQARATVVRQLRMPGVEAVARNYLTGSALAAYRKSATGELWGHQLPLGLQNGDLLPEPLFTPTEKTEVDDPINIHRFRTEFDREIEYQAMKVMALLRGDALLRGLEILDGKFEFGYDALERLALADEISPDALRICLLTELLAALETAARNLPARDKEMVRAWSDQFGLNDKTKFDPRNPEQVAWAQTLVVPPELGIETVKVYHQVFEQWTGTTLRRFQQEVMGL